MKLETFFEKFDEFADAPGAVDKMRELVRQLAVQGRLVDQSPKDEPADTLAATIAEDRAAFVKTRNPARQRVFDAVAEDQYPFALPSGWVWTRLGNLCRVQAGFAFESASFVQGDLGMPMIRIRDITKEHTQVNYAGEYREEFLVNAGDYLVGMDGNFTVAKWRGPRALLNQRVSRLQWYSRHLEPSFFAIAIQYRLSELQGTKAYTTVDHLSSGQIENAVVPLPSLAEQKRIVAKVDELMSLCDRLEAQQKEREARYAILAQASLARFAGAPTPANLEFIFHKSYDVAPADLRKSILTLAVQGKLVPQDPGDEPPRLSSGEPSENGPHDIPSNWRWSGLAELAQFINGDRSKNYPSKSFRVANGVPFINAGHLNNGDVSLDDMDYITEEHFERLGGGKVQRGDILYCLRGSLGKCAIVSSITRGAIASSLLIIRPREMILASFLHAYLVSPLGGLMIEKYDNGSAQPNLSAANVKKYLLPLPPIAEQRRIVAKVDQLMELVDELEGHLTASRDTGAKLLEAVVAELTTATRTAPPVFDGKGLGPLESTPRF